MGRSGDLHRGARRPERLGKDLATEEALGPGERVGAEEAVLVEAFEVEQGDQVERTAHGAASASRLRRLTRSTLPLASRGMSASSMTSTRRGTL